MTLGRDVRGFDYKIRGLNYKTRNATDTKLIYCEGTEHEILTGNCDPGLPDYSPMIYKTVNYKLRTV